MADESPDRYRKAVDDDDRLLDASPTVLIVDDDRALAELYATWLADAYTVRTAFGGADGLEQLDETIEVVVLDRQMPVLSGEKVLNRMRKQGYECPIAMVTGVEPDFDIIEMELDSYLTKPVKQEELEATVKQLLTLDAYEEVIQKYFVLASKLAALQSSKDDKELQANDDYARIRSRIADLEQEAGAQLETLVEADKFDEVFQRLAREQDQYETLYGGRSDDC